MDNNSLLKKILIEATGNVVAAGIVAIIAVTLIDRFYASPQLSGFWKLEIKIDQTDYKPYDGLAVDYIVSILQEELSISGSGDKFSETSDDGSTLIHKGKGRVPIQISGQIEKNFFSKNKAYIIVKESGSQRITTSFHELSIDSDALMTGKFQTSAAMSSGGVLWRRLTSESKENGGL
jgi:hypothetical protein